ncbi:hypothetical protein AS189_02640 [Arthrobacter alpinus]|uniref:DUF2029 domain-containing protein n=1 Tax=Arthrobacter alpinus TaxID=656366 RepID=A0A0S2LVP7_9MICC|nr:glycosyltransferase 87 family protein [Arthrobacter alpinus]ALO65588.1 hypothetical protein AS189_02640 [Arthrobacter alpinus]
MAESQASGTQAQHPIVVPSRSDDLLRTLTEPVGGPLGKRTSPGITNPGFFTVERVLVLIAAVSALLAIMTKSHCRTAGWVTPDQESTVCWSVFPNSFVDDRLGALTPFFSEGSPFGHPVLAGWIAGITAWLTRSAGDGALRQLAFFDLNAALIAMVWIVTVVIVARTAGRRVWDAAIVAASPVLIMLAYVSWDFWAAALVGAGMYLFARKQTLWAGVFFGVAAMAAPYPIFVLLALVFLGIRTGPVAKMLEMVAAAAIAWLLVLAPIMAINPPAFPDYLKNLFAAGPTESSIYGGLNLIAERMGWSTLDVGATNAVSGILLLLLVAGLLAVALYAPRPPRVAQLAFVAAAGFMVLNKGAEPWHAVWLVPLLALAMPRWRPVLVWQAAILTHFIALMLFRSKVLGDISNQHAIDTPYFLIAAVIGAVATWIMVGIVVRDIFTPAYDVVRRGGVSDPQGGILLLLREGTVSVPDAAEQLPLAAGETPIDNAEAR